MKGLEKDGGISPKIQFRLRSADLASLKELVQEANDQAKADGQEPQVTMSSLCRMWVETCIVQSKAMRKGVLRDAPHVLAAAERLREAGK